MSEPRLLLDGPDLRPLLEQAHRLGGQVVRAEKVRRGMGLFARPRYELTVEVAAPASDHSPPEGAGGALADLGVPADLIADAADATAALLALAARLPAPVRPALRPGAVVAVLGEPDLVLETCVHLMVGCREHVPRLLLVGDEEAMPGPGARLTSPRRAARLRAEAAGEAVVVAVGTGTAGARGLAAGVLAGLAPDQAWAAVDAGRAPGETRAALEALPVDRVDALAGLRVTLAARPGALLHLGVPVGLLEGMAATGLAWACVLDAARGRGRWVPQG